MPLENGQQSAENPHPEKLRHLIDEGETSDKVDAPDPAAVPLGTDSEAGGHTPTAQETKTAIDNETRPVTPTPQGQETYYAEASTTKKVIVFALTTACVLIALAAIYKFWN